MIKKILGLLIIGTFSIGTLVSAVFEQIGNYYIGNVGENNVNGSYSYIIDSKMNFDTEYGNSNNIKSFYWSVPNAYGVGTHLYNIAWYEGRLYYIDSYNSEPQMQGFIQNICIRPVSSRGDTFLHEDCTYNDSVDLINNINSIDGFAFSIRGVTSPSQGSWDPMLFCLSDGTNDYCFNCGFTECASGLTGSLNISNTDFSNLQNINWSDSPISGGGEDTEKPITTHPCMTLNELFALRPQYNTGLCYSSDKIRNGTSFETTTQQSIYELYPTYNDFRNDLNLYQNYCGNYVATQDTCQKAFSGKQAEYSLISKLPNNVNDKDLYNYCDLALNYDRNTSTCVINSGATTPKPGTEPTYEDIINAITKGNIQNQTPATGTVFDELCEEGDEECLNKLANRDIIGSLQNIYEKITNLFEKRTGVEGLIPSYIMRLIFLTLFFTILLKK